MSVLGVIIRERKEKDKNMECEFCEYNMAQCEVRHATISQVACGSCANKLDSTWAVHHEFDVSPWDFAG
jgi:hypothetical protein